MSVLWCGGEDIDFPVGGTAVIRTNGATLYYRAAYARCAVQPPSAGDMRSIPFADGGVTSAWLSVRPGSAGVPGFPAGDFFNGRYIGLVSSASGGSNSGIYLGADNNSGRMSFYKWDGTTSTILATEASPSWTAWASGTLKYDIQIISYGATATLNLYANNTLTLTFSGNITIGGVAALDAVCIHFPGTFTGGFLGWSEIIVADEDPRGWIGLATMAPNAQGTTDDWNSTAYTNVNPVTINDANSTYVNSTGLNEQYNLTDLLAGVYIVKAVKAAARALSTTGAVANHLKLGFNSGGSVAVAAFHTPTTAFTTYEDYFATNPVTSAPWGNSVEMNALQVNLQS